MSKDDLCAIMRHLVPVARTLKVLEPTRLCDLVNRTVEQMGPEDYVDMAKIAEAAAHVLREEASTKHT